MQTGKNSRFSTGKEVSGSDALLPKIRMSICHASTRPRWSAVGVFQGIHPSCLFQAKDNDGWWKFQ